MVALTTDRVLGDAVFAVDRSGVIALWGPVAEQMFGYSASKALGKQVWKLLSGQDVYGNPNCGKHCRLRKMALNHEPVNDFNVSYQTAKGARQQFRVSLLTIFGDKGDELLLHICHPKNDLSEADKSGCAARQLDNELIDTLTKRELAVLTLLGGGKSTEEIASILGVSALTVCSHVQHVLHKLQVHTRLEAVLLAQSWGLVKPARNPATLPSV